MACTTELQSIFYISKPRTLTQKKVSSDHAPGFFFFDKPVLLFQSLGLVPIKMDFILCPQKSEFNSL